MCSTSLFFLRTFSYLHAFSPTQMKKSPIFIYFQKDPTTRLFAATHLLESLEVSKAGYYIVPNPSTTLTKVLIIWWRKEILIGLPSLFIAESKHFFKRQALHWFLCVLSIGHLPLKSPWALQVYTRPLWMLLLKKPEQPEKDIFRGVLLTWHKKMAKSPIRGTVVFNRITGKSIIGKKS